MYLFLQCFLRQTSREYSSNAPNQHRMAGNSSSRPVLARALSLIAATIKFECAMSLVLGKQIYLYKVDFIPGRGIPSFSPSPISG
jgi:hypothetical protein